MTTKPDLSREAVERLSDQAEAYAGVCNQTGDDDGLVFMSDTAATLRALLAAKEAAEAELALHRVLIASAVERSEAFDDELTRLRAERGAGWLAGYDAGWWDRAVPFGDRGDTPPPADDAAALEALIREREAGAWDEGYGAESWDENPYRAKENG